ncbi:phytase [Cryptosporangium aurantiacum]|uniref:3-phytase n=1 Tax=Cryptosporangium aurantiacum TaxID=134849 RepID=A0A1M7RGU8_9ACTN|nr:phytase [Cryptosporangium aurantiacum]SHN45392.1 3-phytase [Cryptosporangium aurantiacum]
MRIAAGLIAVVAVAVVSSSVPPEPRRAAAQETAVTAGATVETEPVAHSGDAADDPAIWFDPTDAARSLVIGADKKGALETYDLTGKRIQRIPDVYPNNVDVRGNVVVAADDDTDEGVLRIYLVDPTTRQLTSAATVPTRVTAHGLCLYRSPKTDKLYAFPNSVSGRVEQWELTVRGTVVTAKSVRLFTLGRAVEGCVADDASGALYIGEEKVGIWRYGAEPDAGRSRTMVDGARPEREGHLQADVEGLAIAGDRLYASSQGSSDYTVYGRMDNKYLGRFRVVNSGGVDGCQDTDGIEASSRPLGTAFPAGVFICQDGYNLRGTTVERQNFKLIPLDRVVLPIGTLPIPYP